MTAAAFGYAVSDCYNTVVALTIKNPEVERLARELAAETGETLTGVVRNALQEQRRRLPRGRGSSTLMKDVDEISKRCAALPDLDARPAEEILNYDEKGLPR